MPLLPLTRLGPYEVVSSAGAGGMGEVYRAVDTRLGRHVAIKVLPASTASSPEWRQRLDREARAVSSLSHPNICALYDIGHQDGIDFLVMEFLEGETLAARLERGPLPVDQALKTGIEIADALQGAHRKGIVHRDLKPSNVMLTRTGARLLDFGLAKPLAPAVRGAGGGETVSGALTAEGTLLGTFQYMSPEQVEGREADARSDVFALGAVLHEMLAGRRAFDGETPASVIAAILEREPPSVSSLQPLSPPALDDIVRGCLSKDPDERWQTAHDVKLQLQSLRARAENAADATVTPRRNLREAIAWGLALASLVAAIAFGLTRVRDATPAANPLLRASLLPPAGHSFVPNDFAISPDGRRVAFVAAGVDGVPTLWVQVLDSSQAVEVTGTMGAASPFWSPDSRWVAFFTSRKLMKVEPGGTGIETILDISPGPRNGAWSARDVIVFTGNVLGPLLSVPAAGGAATPVTSVPANVTGEAHRFPEFLRDGKRFLYVASWTNQQRGGVYLASLDGGAPELVSSEIRGRVLLANDHLLFMQGGTLMAQAFDSTSGRLTGVPRAILRNDVVLDWRFGDLPLTASQSGMLVFQSRLAYNTQLVSYDRSGHEQGIVGSPGYSAPALSPDGRRVAVAFDQTGSGQQNLWIHDLQRNISTQLTTTGMDTAHNWSPDGKWILFSSIRNQNGIYRRLADGSGTEETIMESPAHLLVNAYAPDSRDMLYMDFRSGQAEVRRYDFKTKKDEPAEGGAEASYSHDGKWIASVGPPAWALTVRPTTGNGRVPISDGSGGQPRWRGDGKEIFYIAPDKKLMAVQLALKNETLEPGPPKALFQTRIVRPSFVLFQYDVTADGQRFLINSLPREDAAAPLTLLSNWTQVANR